ncbi:lactonase family protein [Lacticaseibacillus baoqingensis]|uniref:Lactonase family protein n=1 Tax=Lacticaseibacillus baoqingensis TaxID=2486013 RepID=A0ABW4E255_9LACO|nr:lactonase family protein [Lacticaseibacillus baoqingensis]
MKEIVLLGGYTRKTGQGIYKATFDSDSGTLTTPTPYVTTLKSPTYLAVSKAGFAYAVAADDGKGGVATIDLHHTPGVVLDRSLAPGGSPAHISIDENRQLVFASFYHDGRVNVYQIQADHTLKPVAVAVHSGHGPRPEQTASHVHYAALSPDGRLAVVDLGNDTVASYPVAADGKLGKPATLHLPAGYGPRHLAFLPGHDDIAYLVGELSSQISVLEYHAGQFTLGETRRTIPADWTAHNGAAAIRISADGRFVYVSNRGYNGIAVFAVTANGQHLELVQQITTHGEFPRDFNLDLSQKYLLAVNQNTDNATLYRRDADSGKLTTLVADIPAPEAVNVTFLSD